MLDAAVIAARFCQFASALILFGAAAFLVYGDPRLIRTRQWPRRLLLMAAAIALASGVSWLMLEAVALSGDAKSATDASFLWLVLRQTQFGRVFLLRLLTSMATIAVFVPAALPPRVLLRILIVLGAVLVASFAWTGHGAIDQGAAGTVHLAADLLHLFAAALWLGALVPLSVVLARPSHSQGENRDTHDALARFSGIGAALVGVLVISGIVNSWFLVGPAHLDLLFTTAYGLVLLVKLMLFAIMLALAATNRFRLTPQLKASLTGGDDTAAALRALKKSVTIETALGLLVLLAVGALGTLPPPVSGG